MASLVHTITDNYRDWHMGKNAEVDSWFLMASPGSVLGLLLAYLLFVLRIGPSLMKDRPAMELRKTLVVYNGVQVAFSAWLVYKILQIDFPIMSIFSTRCTTRDAHMDKLINNCAWFYHVAKLSEFMDTIFFVLRKKNKQISFLHVYHHSITMFFSWCYLKYAPGEQGICVGLFNSSVHVVMYFYYMVAAMGPQYQKYIWWKKYMTIIQLVQFLIIITCLCIWTFSNCGYQKSLTYFFIFNALIFLYLFTDFYRKSYKKGPSGKASNGNAFKYVLKDENINGKIVSQIQPFPQLVSEVAYIPQDDFKKRE